jgi:protein involved in polysaccharide export with SLBB domain
MVSLFRPSGVCHALLFALCLTTALAAQDGIEETARRAAMQLIRPGDRIQLTFTRDRELSGEIGVNERGDAVFPKVGTINLSQTRIGDLQDTLKARYREYLREPEFQVMVQRRVVVNGEVRVPNVYFVDVTSGVRDAIARAGGLLETAKGSDVNVVRGGKKHRIKAWTRDESPNSDLQSGDQVVVGRKGWLELNALSVISTSVIVIGLIRSLRQ